jgi:hypothetical protein
LRLSHSTLVAVKLGTMVVPRAWDNSAASAELSVSHHSLALRSTCGSEIAAAQVPQSIMDWLHSKQGWWHVLGMDSVSCSARHVRVHLWLQQAPRAASKGTACCLLYG